MQLTLFAPTEAINPPSSSGKTCQESSAPKTTHSVASLLALPVKSNRWNRQGADGQTLVMCLAPSEQSRGESSMPNISDWPNAADVCSLSQVLETTSIPQRFFLSSTACAGILRRAVAIERRMEPLSAELQKLHAQQRPTLKDALGDTGVLWYSVVRSLLISIMGLVMFGASGAMLRAARSGRALPAPVAQPEATALPQSAPVAQPHTSAAPANAMPADVPQPLFGAGVGKWQAGMAVGAAALTLVAAFAVPSPLAQAPAQQHSGAQVASTTSTSASTVAQEGGSTVWSTVQHTSSTVKGPVQAQFEAIEAQRDNRYDHLKAGVAVGAIKPSVRGLQAVTKIGTAKARQYLEQMVGDGVIVGAGQGYALKA